jgi:hypothetical protein
MELTKEQLNTVQELSKEIEFGRVTINFAGNPHNNIVIVGEKQYRFHHEKASPTEGKAADRQRSGRI